METSLNFDLRLGADSKPEWIAAVVADFDAFLVDHADCERKASAMAMSFVAKYPNRKEIIPELIEIGIEELAHFKQVYELMQERDVSLPPKMSEDLYVKGLIKFCRDGREDRFLDRLMVASVAECRGAERFRLVAEAQTDNRMRSFYHNLYKSEEKHGLVYIEMARNYFDDAAVAERQAFFIEKEAEVLNGLEIRAALH